MEWLHDMLQRFLCSEDGPTEVYQLDFEGLCLVINHHYVPEVEITVDHPDPLQCVKCCGNLKVQKPVRMYQSRKLTECAVFCFTTDGVVVLPVW